MFQPTMSYVQEHVILFLRCVPLLDPEGVQSNEKGLREVPLVKSISCPAPRPKSIDFVSLFVSICRWRQRIEFLKSDLREVHPHVKTYLTVLNHRSSTRVNTCVGPLGYNPRLQAIVTMISVISRATFRRCL